jgi:hypothetical protein
MDTSARNRALAAAAKKLGLKEVADRLCINDALLHLYTKGEFPVPDPVWMLFLSEGLNPEVVVPRGSQSVG